MGRLKGLALIVLIWAGVYLPGLGSLQIKGEEGRRILPARTMLESGEWVVPYVGGEPYLRKPPLVNWVIAGSFKLTGIQNEWTARLPSVLCLLVLAAAIVLLASQPATGLIAAIFMLSFVGIIEKGRLAEIEALYVTLTGLAILSWAHLWRRNASPWLLWPIPSVFLGLGLLAKAPLHLLFFYVLVVFVLRRERRLRLLLHPGHWLGLLLMLGIFACWAVPYFSKVAALNPVGIWGAQFAGRVGGEFDFSGWLTNIPRGLSNLMPWVVFAPLLWKIQIEDDARLRSFFPGTRSAVVWCFFGLLLIPGILPRYTLPLVTPLAMILAETIQRSGIVWRNRWRSWVPFCKSCEPVQLALASGLVMVMITLVYAMVAVPRLRRHNDMQSIAGAIEEKVPQTRMLYVLDPGYMPALFYFQRPFIYLKSLDGLTEKDSYLLVRKEQLQKAGNKLSRSTGIGRWQSRKGLQLELLNTSQASELQNVVP